jgi:polysaccharide deacetylase family protein (PEP-CTERM system associated)
MSVHALSIDVEDWFQVENFARAIPREDWDEKPLRVEESTRRLLDILDRSGTRATFFCLGWVADRCPGLIRDIVGAGHELATHGYAHRLVYRQTPEEFEEDLVRSLGALRAAVGDPSFAIRGYRAPSFSITRESLWALEVLERHGIEYDSSIFPVAGHHRYGIPGSPRFPHRLGNDLTEIPVSTLRLGRWNVPVAGGGYFRLYPLAVTRRAIRRLEEEGQAAVVYLHPWEVDPEQPAVPEAGWLARFRHGVGLARTASRLEALLSEFRFVPMRELHRAFRETPACASSS